MAMTGTQDLDMRSWSEADFEENCTYIVKDHPLEEESKSHGKTRAEMSLPRNLALKRSQRNSTEVRLSSLSNTICGVLAKALHRKHIVKSFNQKYQSRNAAVVYVFTDFLCVTPTSFRPLIHPQAGCT